jgi:hypothetical protein
MFLSERESGIVFSGIQHEANVQQNDEKVERVKAIYDEMRGRLYTAKDLSVGPLGSNDFLFIAPYNAQFCALQKVLPNGARIGSVDVSRTGGSGVHPFLILLQLP